MKRTLLVLTALALVSGCGLKGKLDQPPPMWGDRSAYDREHAADRDHKSHDQQAQRPRTTTSVTSGFDADTNPSNSTPTSPTEPSTTPQ